MIHTSTYINPNTRAITSNIKNTAVKDKRALQFMSDELIPVEDLEKVLKTSINLAGSTNINRNTNSVNLAAGARITVMAGYVLTIKPQGVEVSGGDPYDQKAWEEAQNMATALSTLLRNAGGTMKTVAYGKEEFQKWTDNVAKVMKYFGIDTEKEFTVNGVKYSKNEEGYFESEITSAAKAAYEKLQADNMTYEFADEATRKRIDYISNYYLSDVPEEIITAWKQTMKETGINPFARGNGSTLVQLAVEQDFTTGGNDKIFGNSVESVLSTIDDILERIENRLSEAETKNQKDEKIFYTELKNQIMESGW